MKRTVSSHDPVFQDEQFAARYLKKHRSMADKFGREYARKLRAQGFKKGKIIDVGCGFGGTALALAGSFPAAEIVGIDLSDPLLTAAKQSVRDRGGEGRICFKKADVQNIPYDDDSFDAALNINMVHLVEAPLYMLDEIERVLKPGGLLFIADLRRSWLGLVEKEIQSALTLKEAKNLFDRSCLRKGEFSSDILWWRFESTPDVQ